jgi:hypothetical protein
MGCGSTSAARRAQCCSQNERPWRGASAAGLAQSRVGAARPFRGPSITQTRDTMRRATLAAVFVVLFASQGVAQGNQCDGKYWLQRYVEWIRCQHQWNATHVFADLFAKHPALAEQLLTEFVAQARRAEASHLAPEQYNKERFDLSDRWKLIFEQEEALRSPPPHPVVYTAPPPPVIYVRPPEVNVTVEGPAPSAYQPMRRPNCLSTLGTPAGYATRNQILSNCE